MHPSAKANDNGEVSPRLRQVLAVLAGLVALSLGAALMTNQQTGAQRAAEAPAPTSTPTTTPTAGPSPTPTPTPTPRPVIPINEIITAVAAGTWTQTPAAAGDRCPIIVDGDEPVVVGWFTLPSGTATKDCEHLSFPRAQRLGTAVSARMSAPRNDLMTVLNRDLADANEHLLLESIEYAPVAGASGYRVSFAPSTGRGVALRHLIDVRPADGWSLGVFTLEVWSTHWDTPEVAHSVGAMQQIADSIEWVAEPQPAPEQGGTCTGIEWWFDVPEDWFAFNQCSHLNTSSDAPWRLQCECLGPIGFWERPRTEPLVGDVLERSDGLRYSVVEEFRDSEYIGGRNYRTIMIELPTTSLVIEGVREVDHALPGHTWQDTVDAMDLLVESLRVVPVDTSVDVPMVIRDDLRSSAGDVTFTEIGADRWLISDRRLALDDAPDWQIWADREFGLSGVIERVSEREYTFEGHLHAPAGPAICIREVRDLRFVERPDGSTWTADSPCSGEIDLVFDTPAATQVEQLACVATELPESATLVFEREVDIDGDGLDERVKLRSPTLEGPISVWVEFDDGSTLESALVDTELTLDHANVDWDAQPLAIDGMSAETLAATNTYPSRQRYTELLGFSGCEAKVLHVLEAGSSTGWCAGPINPVTRQQHVRLWTWYETEGARQPTTDLVLRGRGDSVITAGWNVLPERPCGPEVPLGVPDAEEFELSGLHELTLSSGDVEVRTTLVRFRPAGDGSYLANRQPTAAEPTIEGAPMLAFAYPHERLWQDGIVERRGNQLHLETARLSVDLLEGCGIDVLTTDDGGTTWTADMPYCQASVRLTIGQQG